MITKEIFGENRIIPHSKERACARGIVVHEGKILLSYVPKSDFYMTPGGGLEEGESLFECCIREIAEETGYVVTPEGETPFYILNEYYREYKFINNFFICSLTGKQTKIKLTEIEKEQQLVMKWLDLNEALHVFSRYDDYTLTDYDKCGSYLRDYTAIESALEIGAI